jgi:hypothetical protein
MSDASANRSIFISCVSDEFEKPQAPFPGLRNQLRFYLTRADCEVKVQEEFRQTGGVDTIEKLAGYISKCAAVIHLVGMLPGYLAHKKAVADYLAKVPGFLANYPDLRAALGDCSDLSFTQWEAFLALHYGVPLFVYATDKASAQQKHLDRLLIGQKFAAPIKDHSDLLGQLIGDIHSIIASVPKFTRKIASSRILRHAPKVLEQLCAELDADIDWHRRGARLTRMANQWERDSRPKGQLLRAGAISDADVWAARRPTTPTPSSRTIFTELRYLPKMKLATPRRPPLVWWR